MFANKIEHVDLNSFKHFSAPKMNPLVLEPSIQFLTVSSIYLCDKMYFRVEWENLKPRKIIDQEDSIFIKNIWKLNRLNFWFDSHCTLKCEHTELLSGIYHHMTNNFRKSYCTFTKLINFFCHRVNDPWNVKKPELAFYLKVQVKKLTSNAIKGFRSYFKCFWRPHFVAKTRHTRARCSQNSLEIGPESL